jgi:hypothetical protein
VRYIEQFFSFVTGEEAGWGSFEGIHPHKTLISVEMGLPQGPMPRLIWQGLVDGGLQRLRLLGLCFLLSEDSYPFVEQVKAKSLLQTGE